MRKSSTKKEVEKVVRRTRKKFEGFLKATDKLDSDRQLKYLGGSSAKVEGSSNRRKELGLNSYPRRSQNFLDKLGQVDGLQVYVIAWPQDPKYEVLKGDKKDVLVEIKYYGNILGDLIASPGFPPFPSVPSPTERYEVPKKDGGTKKVGRVAVMVMHQYATGDKTHKTARVSLRSKLVDTFLASDKLNNFRLSMYFNPVEGDECLQAVDVLVNFFYQTIHFGLEVEVKSPGKAITRKARPGPGSSGWERIEWKRAFNSIKPKIKLWKNLDHPRKPVRYLKDNR